MPTPTPLIEVTTATRPGSHGANQDHVVITDHAAAVLDGASSWPPAPTDRDGGWYARTLGAVLATRLDGPEPLAEILADAITRVRDEHDLVPGDSPSSTVVLARWTTDAVDLLVLGDSTAVIAPRTGQPEAITDHRLSRVAPDQRHAIAAALREGRAHGHDHTRRVAALQVEQRRHRNTPGGYWIAEADPQAARQAVTRRHAPGELRAVLLATDGVADGVTVYCHPGTWGQALDLATDQGPGALIDTVHAIEETDPAGTRWPRSNRHDDKTAVLVRMHARQ